MSFKGLTDEGLEVPTGNEWLTLIRDSIDARLPEDESFPYTENDVLGAITNELAFRLGQLSEALKAVDDTKSVQTATGVHLEDAVGLLGVQRSAGQPSKITDFEFRGDFQAIVPAGTQLKGGGQDDTLLWETLSAVELGIAVIPDQDLSSKDYNPGVSNSGDIPTGSYELDIKAPAGASSWTTFTYTLTSAGDQQELLNGWKRLIEASDISGMVDIEVRDIGKDGDGDVMIIRSPKGFDLDAQPGDATTDSKIKIEKGLGIVDIEATDVGPLDANNGDTSATVPSDTEAITEIISSVDGVDNVRNITDANLGKDEDSDKDLRLAHAKRLQSNATGSANAIRSALEDLDFIEAAAVPENESDSTVSVTTDLDLNPHSIAPIIWPNALSDDQKETVAKTVYKNLSHGIEAVKDTDVSSSNRFTKTIQTKGQTTKDVTIYYAVEATINVKVDTTIDGSFSESDIRAQIKTVLTDYIEGLTVAAEVRRLEIYGAIDDIVGVQSVSKLELEKNSGGFSASDVTISQAEIASAGTITVTFV